MSLRRLEREGGAIAVLVAVFALVMFGLAAIVVDLGMVRVTKADSRAATDSAALAGAAALYREPDTTPRPDEAVAAVKDSAERNGTPRGDWDGCSATPPGPAWVATSAGTTCIMFDSLSSPRRVFVALPVRRVDAAFGGVVGYSGSDVTASAQAQARDRSLQDCSLCVADLLTVDGRVTVDGDGSATTGRLVVSSTGRLGLTQAAVDAGGGIGAQTWPPSPDPPSTRYSPQPQQVPTADPFSGTPRPVLPVNDLSSFTCNSGVLPTGVAYRNVTINGACAVSGGTVFIARRLRVNSGASLTGTGATLYFTCRRSGPNRAEDCDAGGPSSTLQVRSGGTLRLAGGALSAGARPLAVFFDPDNSNAMRVDGTLDVSGASAYLREGSISVTGAMTIGGLVSTGDLTVGSGDTLDLTASGLGSQPGAFRLALVK